MKMMNSFVRMIALSFLFIGGAIETIKAQGPTDVQFTPVGFPPNVETIDIVDEPVANPKPGKDYFVLSELEPFKFSDFAGQFRGYLKQQVDFKHPYLVVRFAKGPYPNLPNRDYNYYDALILHDTLGKYLQDYKGFSLWAYFGPRTPRKLYRVYNERYIPFDKDDFSGAEFSRLIKSLRIPSDDYPRTYYAEYLQKLKGKDKPNAWETQLILNNYLGYPERLDSVISPDFLMQFALMNPELVPDDVVKKLWNIYSEKFNSLDDAPSRQTLKENIMKVRPGIVLDSWTSRGTTMLKDVAQSTYKKVGDWIPGMGRTAAVSGPSSTSFASPGKAAASTSHVPIVSTQPAPGTGGPTGSASSSTVPARNVALPTQSGLRFAVPRLSNISGQVWPIRSVSSSSLPIPRSVATEIGSASLVTPTPVSSTLNRASQASRQMLESLVSAANAERVKALASGAAKYTTETAGSWYNKLYDGFANAYSGLVNRFGWYGN